MKRIRCYIAESISNSSFQSANRVLLNFCLLNDIRVKFKKSDKADFIFYQSNILSRPWEASTFLSFVHPTFFYLMLVLSKSCIPPFAQLPQAPHIFCHFIFSYVPDISYFPGCPFCLRAVSLVNSCNSFTLIKNYSFL